MKKLIVIIIAALLLCSCGRMNIVGNQYVVTSVERYQSGNYHTNYKIKIRSVHPRANINTWDGNKFTMYTDELYMVGDTLTII